jgi:amino acid transporter
MTEETHNAAMSGSIGIIMAIGVSALLGWFLILGLLFSIQDLDGTLNSSTGQPVTQIFLDTVGERGAIVLMVIVIGAMYFCGCVLIVRELGRKGFGLNYWLVQDVLDHLEFEDDVRVCEGWWHSRTQILRES